MNTQNNGYQLLGGRLEMLSAPSGYRAAIDPVLLAASVPAKAGDKVLDVGCGTGAAALCLATRLPDIQVRGIDAQAPLIALANEIAQLNALQDRTKFLPLDLQAADQLQPVLFDHVIANPPHHKKGSGNPSPDPLKAAANVEGEAGLRDWVSFCFARVKPRGTVSFVHRYDRMVELADLMAAEGMITIFPLWPKVQGAGAKRVLVQAIKGKLGDTLTRDGLVLHNSEDRYTKPAHAILREAGPLNI